MKTPPVRLRNTQELIASLPHQLGYRPVDSLVLILFGPLESVPDTTKVSGTIQMMGRIDLPTNAVDYGELLDCVDALLRRQQPDAVEIFAFEDSRPDVTEVLLGAGRIARGLGVTVLHRVRVRGSRTLIVADESECREAGHLVDETCLDCAQEGVWRELPPADQVPAVADLVLLGHSPGPSRAQLEQRIHDAGLSQQLALGEELDRMSAEFDEPEGAPADSWLSRAAQSWRRILDTSPRAPAVADLGPGLLAQGVLLLENREFRDGLITWLAPGQLGPGMLPDFVLQPLMKHLPIARLDNLAQLDRLVALCGLVPDEWAAPVLTVTAQVAWALNRGTVANIAIVRAREVDPDYYLADLTDRLLQHGVRPPRGPFPDAA